MNPKYYTITALNKSIKKMFDEKLELNNIHLKGEISNFKHHTRGHYYFTLKDENSQISAIMFSSSTKNINFEPTDGMKVLVSGKVTVYETTGSYQIYVNEMMQDGLGNLYLEFEKLKKKLEAEGLFKKDHKKDIPKYPMKIGIITASTGAAIRDILSTIKRRFPICETILFPCLVQGTDAKNDIVRNIKIANTYPLDVIILGRGGGSIEDLWAFNEEIVARSIYDSKIPIISGVGHEIDFTISDFVADLRAPTPTAAAEMAVPNTSDVRNNLLQYQARLLKAITNKIDKDKKILDNLKNNYILKNPMSLYEKQEQNFDHLYESLLNALKININNIIENKKNIYLNLLSKVEVLNPITTIKRGYTITKIKDKVITSIKNIKKDDQIITSVSDGEVESVVVNVYSKSHV